MDAVKKERLTAAGIDVDDALGRFMGNEALLERYSPKLEGHLPGSCPDGSPQTPVRTDQLTRAEFALNAGDRVVLLTEDQQEYYLFSKVVPLV